MITIPPSFFRGKPDPDLALKFFVWSGLVSLICVGGIYLLWQTADSDGNFTKTVGILIIVLFSLWVPSMTATIISAQFAVLKLFPRKWWTSDDGPKSE